LQIDDLASFDKAAICGFPNPQSARHSTAGGRPPSSMEGAIRNPQFPTFALPLVSPKSSSASLAEDP
jgi:hypothetical protein